MHVSCFNLLFSYSFIFNTKICYNFFIFELKENRYFKIHSKKIVHYMLLKRLLAITLSPCEFMRSDIVVLKGTLSPFKTVKSFIGAIVVRKLFTPDTHKSIKFHGNSECAKNLFLERHI